MQEPQLNQQRRRQQHRQRVQLQLKQQPLQHLKGRKYSQKL